jgi:hypothetical protein
LPCTKCWCYHLMDGCLGFEHRLAVSHTARKLTLRRLGEVAALVGRACIPYTGIASNILAFALQLRQITQVVEGRNARRLSVSGKSFVYWMAVSFPYHPLCITLLLIGSRYFQVISSPVKIPQLLSPPVTIISNCV